MELTGTGRQMLVVGQCRLSCRLLNSYNKHRVVGVAVKLIIRQFRQVYSVTECELFVSEIHHKTFR